MAVTAALPAISATAITIVSAIVSAVATVVTGEVIDGIVIVSFHSRIQENERYTVTSMMVSFACFWTYETKDSNMVIHKAIGVLLQYYSTTDSILKRTEAILSEAVDEIRTVSFIVQK